MTVCTSSVRCYLTFLVLSGVEQFLLLRIFNKSLNVALILTTGMSCAFVISSCFNLILYMFLFLLNQSLKDERLDFSSGLSGFLNSNYSNDSL